MNDEYNTAIHWDGYGDDHEQSSLVVNAPLLHEIEWHTFAFEWRKSHLRWYYDGLLVRETEKGEEIPLVPLFTIISGEVKGYWADCNLRTASWPDYMYVDYVRIWK